MSGGATVGVEVGDLLREVGPVFQKPAGAFGKTGELVKAGFVDELDGEERNNADHGAHAQGVGGPSGGRYWS